LLHAARCRIFAVFSHNQISEGVFNWIDAHLDIIQDSLRKLRRSIRHLHSQQRAAGRDAVRSSES
ncbi:MAG: hypothetical protein ACYDHE_23635, partial [Candidatus Acidiferrales bacterium]